MNNQQPGSSQQPNGAQSTSSFPPPPAYYRNYGSSVANPPPPPAIPRVYTAYGDQIDLEAPPIRILSQFIQATRKILKMFMIWLTKSRLFLLIAQLCFVPLLAMLAPLYLRSTLLATPVRQEILLEMQYPQCEADYRTCPFPMASFNIEDYLAPFTYYKFLIRIHFSDEEINTKIGLFSNEIKLYDNNTKSLGRWRRTGLAKTPNIINQLTKVILLSTPFKSIVDFLERQNPMDMLIVKNFYNSPYRPAKKLVFILQDHYVQFDDIYLIITAKTGILAYCFENFPFSTYAITAGLILAIGYSTLIVFWISKVIRYYRNFLKQL